MSSEDLAYNAKFEGMILSAFVCGPKTSGRLGLMLLMFHNFSGHGHFRLASALPLDKALKQF
jgi:hypothetical protein